MARRTVRHCSNGAAGPRTKARGCVAMLIGRAGDSVPAADCGLAWPGHPWVHPHQPDRAGVRLCAERLGVVRAVPARTLAAPAAHRRGHALYRGHRPAAAAQLPRRRGIRAGARRRAGDDHVAVDLLASWAASLRSGLCTGAARRTPGADCAGTHMAGRGRSGSGCAGGGRGVGAGGDIRAALAAAPGHGRRLLGADDLGRRPGGAAPDTCGAGSSLACHPGAPDCA